MIRPVSSQLADSLRLWPTPASSDEVGCSAVNRRGASSNPARGANLRFFSQLNATRPFGPLPKGRWFKSGLRNHGLSGENRT